MRDASTEYKGTLGNAMPGKQVDAFIVEELDPVKCVGYNNIIIHCGINSIRDDNIESDEHVRDVYVKFKSKVQQIITVNKRARVYVDCLLPTKIEKCNIKVRYFNKLIQDDLTRSFKDIRIIDTFSKFTSVKGLLSSKMSREFNRNSQPDYLHLNDVGLRVLSVCIKKSIFAGKQGEGNTAGRGRGGAGGRAEWPGLLDHAGATRRPRGGGRNNRGWRGRPQ